MESDLSGVPSKDFGKENLQNAFSKCDKDKSTLKVQELKDNSLFVKPESKIKIEKKQDIRSLNVTKIQALARGFLARN